MPDTILDRTVFMEFDNRPVMAGKGVFRPCDFALVKTPLGMMVEPFTMFAALAVDVDIANYDSSEELRRIDRIEFVNLDTYPQILSNFDGIILHGGNLIPRSGR